MLIENYWKSSLQERRNQIHWRLQPSRKCALAMGHNVNIQATGLIASSKQMFEEISCSTCMARN